jgi:hypothetical protein
VRLCAPPTPLQLPASPENAPVSLPPQAITPGGGADPGPPPRRTSPRCDHPRRRNRPGPNPSTYLASRLPRSPHFRRWSSGEELPIQAHLPDVPRLAAIILGGGADPGPSPLNAPAPRLPALPTFAGGHPWRKPTPGPPSRNTSSRDDQSTKKTLTRLGPPSPRTSHYHDHPGGRCRPLATTPPP